MKKALFPGRFDPLHFGHLDLIARMRTICDHLIVGIGENTEKGTTILTLNEILEALKKETKKFPNVEVIPFKGLATDFAKENNVQVLIRGLRSESDFFYEMQMAKTNQQLSGIETFFLIADPKTMHISSSIIRELASLKAPLKKIIPEYLEHLFYKRMQKEK